MKYIFLMIGICFILLTSGFVYCILTDNIDGAQQIECFFCKMIDKIKEPIVEIFKSVNLGKLSSGRGNNNNVQGSRIKRSTRNDDKAKPNPISF